MTLDRQPPRLVVKMLAVTFLMVFVLLVVVFVVVTVSVRDQVRQSVIANLKSSQRVFAALETWRQRELVAQAGTLAESPTLKAALDTYQTEAKTGGRAVKEQLLATIDGELTRVAARIESDVIVLADMHQNTLAAAGRLSDRWPRGRPIALSPINDGNTVDGIAHRNGETFHLVPVPLQDSDGTTIVFYALRSIDESSSGATRQAMRSMAFIAVGAVALALFGSVTLARLLAEPIGRLSSSLAAMAASRDVRSRIPPSRSSRELDALTETFNALIASVAEAEAHTEAAYTGAIRALAAALDARDPYTAGHSDRVSVLSVAIGRGLSLPPDDLEVLRLGALLHDIGKIGVPDDVLRKPGALTPEEFDIIKQHPVLGARILQSVPFLAKHIPIVELHHERPDGRGYPDGLRGDEIPRPARIVHVADAYDAMTSARAYRAARPSGDALRELWRCAGSEFHAEIVAALATALPGVTSDAADVPQHV